jgi:hypothetical protein
MPRIRSIKPELFMSPQVMNLSRDARLLFIGLITQADDEGRGTADPRKLKAVIFPGDDDITSARVLELEAEIESQALCVTYDGNGHGRLYALPSWKAHQYVPKFKESSYPSPPKAVAEPHSGNDTGSLPSQDGRTTGGSDLKDRKDLKGSGTRARAVDHGPVDNPDRRALAPDDLKKSTDRRDEIEQNRRRAADIARDLAARAKA